MKRKTKREDLKEQHFPCGFGDAVSCPSTCNSTLPSIASDEVTVPAATSNLVALDCEMVGVGARMTNGLGRCSIIDGSGQIIMDSHVIPPLGVASITDFRTRYSGIRPVHMQRALPFDAAMRRAREVLDGKVVVGHALGNDFQVMGFRPPLKCIRDTSRYKPLYDLALESQENASISRGLRSLTRHVLKRKIQTGEHDSVEDARAALDLYKTVSSDWEEDISAGRFVCRDYDLPGAKSPGCACQGKDKTSQDERVKSKTWPCVRTTTPTRTRTKSMDGVEEFVKDSYWDSFPEVI